MIGYKEYHKDACYLVVRLADGSVNQFGTVYTKREVLIKLKSLGIEPDSLVQQENGGIYLPKEAA
jgi:hypothetical protein